MLVESDVETALAETNLPQFVKTALATAEYADADALQTAVTDAIAEVKRLTSSGQVFGQGQAEAGAEPTPEQHERARIDRFNELMREVGLREISNEEV